MTNKNRIKKIKNIKENINVNNISKNTQLKKKNNRRRHSIKPRRKRTKFNNSKKVASSINSNKYKKYNNTNKKIQQKKKLTELMKFGRHKCDSSLKLIYSAFKSEILKACLLPIFEYTIYDKLKNKKIYLGVQAKPVIKMLKNMIESILQFEYSMFLMIQNSKSIFMPTTIKNSKYLSELLEKLYYYMYVVVYNINNKKINDYNTEIKLFFKLLNFSRITKKIKLIHAPPFMIYEISLD